MLGLWNRKYLSSFCFQKIQIYDKRTKKLSWLLLLVKFNDYHLKIMCDSWNTPLLPLEGDSFQLR